MRKYNTNRKEGTPLRMKLFWILAVFFLLVIALLWVFQVVFMDGFYRSVTTAKMSKSADRIETVIKSGGDIRAATFDAAENSGSCVTVYMIKQGSGMKVADAHIKNGCYLHNIITGDVLNRIYGDTENAGGRLEAMVGADNGETILYSRIMKSPTAEYMLLFGTESFPVGTMATTVTIQLTLITVILLIGAGVLAVIISRKITRPVSELCTQAERLAVGDYGVSFSECSVEEMNRLGDTLQYAAKELERADKMKRELIANITHDLRTPLTMISGYSEVMRDIPGEVTAENIQVIIDESARLSALVNDVLEMSAAQNNGMTLNKSLFSISDMVKDVTNRYSAMLEDKGYRLAFESDGDNIMTIGDEVKLGRVLCNLINNAVHFAGDDKSVTVRLRTMADACRIEITDTGRGIPADELESIWDRYYRARDFQNKGIAGSGLGLSIVKHILILHGASFGVESTVGVGSTFWFEVKREQ